MPELQINVDADGLDTLAPSVNPDDYETHELIEDSMRGPKGAIVSIHKNDLAILRANKLIAEVGDDDKAAKQAKAEADKAAKQAKAEADKAAKQAKAEADKAAKQAKAEADKAAKQAKAEAVQDAPAQVPQLADMPAGGV